VKLIAPLFSGPLDIIGDVHGEIAALQDLLAVLGYAPDGSHPGQRRLVFLGDLIDRGPDSPAVLNLVESLVESGRAQCLLGNHELNLLRDIRKHGNDWFMKPEAQDEFPGRPVSAAAKPAIRAFLATLPVVLERADLRLVHACWNERALGDLLAANSSDVLSLYQHYQARADEQRQTPAMRKALLQEYRTHGESMRDPDWQPVFLPAIAAADVAYQMSNPLRILTSGEEATSETPFWAGGRWRMVERVRWWEHYREAVPVIIGHYWRRYSEAAPLIGEKYGPDIFAGIAPHQWMGPARSVYCVDFSVGSRAAERQLGRSVFAGKLAALRVPEWQVIHDDGDTWEIGPPGSTAVH